MVEILVSCALLSAGAQEAFAAKHRFIAIDEGLGNLLYVNENDSSANWIVKVNRKVGADSIYAPRDMQLVGNNRILIGHTHGFTEFNCATGAVARDFLGYDSVSSVRRLPGGQTLIFGVDLDGSKGVVMVKLDSQNVKIKKVVWPGTYVRLVRQTKTGTFLMACNDTIKEADTNGTFIWKTYLQGTLATNKHMWKIVRLDNGNVFVAAGYGAFLAEVNASGAIVREIGAAPQPAGVNPYFYGMSQIMPNGDVVVANWEGHGAGHGNAGIALLEFNASGTIVWQWNKPAIISSLQGVLVLDSLNTNLLYDDRNGTMAPLATTRVGWNVERTRQSPASSASPRWRTAIRTSASHDVSGRSVSLSGRSIMQTATAKTAVNSSMLGAGVFVNKSASARSHDNAR
jgi:hypothetical protein